MNNLPKAEVIGRNSNVFNLLGICNNALRSNSVSKEKIEEMNQRVQKSDSYNDALSIMQEYVEFV